MDKTTALAWQHEIAASSAGRDITRGLLNPQQLAPVDDTVLLERGGGDYRAYDATLRDDTVRAAVNQRVQGVIARPWEVRAGGKRALDQAAAELLRQTLARLPWDHLCAQMLSGVFYGFSVAEVIWDSHAGQVDIADIRVRNRRRFAFDGAGGLRLKTLTNPWPGEAMPERKFWLARFGADHHDAPYGLGLAHYLYWPVWMKRHALRFWAVHLEKFGTPTVVGYYPLGTAPEDQGKLLQATQAAQRESTLIMPEGMRVELLEATRGGSADHHGFINAMDKAILKVALGQTSTVEGTAGKLGQDGERERVKETLVQADADLLSASFNTTVAKWLTEFNFAGAAVPTVWRVFDTEDLDRRAARDKTLYAMGFAPSLDYVHDTYGGQWSVRSAPPTESGPEPEQAEAALHAAPPNPAALPLPAAAPWADPTPVTAQVQQLQAEAATAWADILRHIEQLLDQAGSLPELQTALLAAYGDLPSAPLVKVMALALAAADLAGRFDVVQEGQA